MDLNQAGHGDIGLKSGQSLIEKTARLRAAGRLETGGEQNQRRQDKAVQRDALFAEIRGQRQAAPRPVGGGAQSVGEGAHAGRAVVFDLGSPSPGASSAPKS